MSKTKYLVKNGLSYEVKGEEVRREPGDVADDIPTRSIKWLLGQGHIEPHTEPKKGS